MAEVYTTTPGDLRQIGNYGLATNDTPAIVPDEVAAELADNPRFRVEGITKKLVRELKEEAREEAEEAALAAEPEPELKPKLHKKKAR